MAATRLVALALFALVLSSARVASADLEHDVTRVEAAWKKKGHAVRQRPRMLERGAILPVQVPVSMLDPQSGGCVTVALLGVTTAHFVLHVGGSRARQTPSETALASSAGVAEITRCGLSRLDLMNLAIEMRSPRALLETLIADSAGPLVPVAELLPQRDAGPAADFGTPGPRPAPAPLAQRLSMLEARLRREGAATISRQGFRSRADGSGETTLTLEAGCHELHLLSDDASAAQAVSLDLSLDLNSESDEPAVAEPSETSDAAQKLCLGRSVRALLHFGGVGSERTVTLVFARFELPRGLPDYWGPLTRARVASTLRRYRLRLPGGSPFYQSLGVQGVIGLPVEVTPGTCYVAVLTAIRGDLAGMSLAVDAGSGAQNSAIPPQPGSALAFCARDSTRASFELESKGFGLGWLFSVWEAGKLNPGEIAR